jgi:hypothetical protein
MSNTGPTADGASSSDEIDAEAERFFAAGEAGEPRAELVPDEPEANDAWGEPTLAPPSPELLARRARLRAIVATGLVGGVLLLLGSIALARLPSRAPKVAVAVVAAGAPTASPVTSPAPPSIPPIQSSEPVASALTAEPVASTVSASPLGSSDASSPALESARSLAAKARRLLQGGRIKDGVAAARAAIDADPSRPEGYVLLAAGLEDLGLWREAHDAFSRCVRRSHEGPASPCAYFAKAGP